MTNNEQKQGELRQAYIDLSGREPWSENDPEFSLFEAGYNTRQAELWQNLDSMHQTNQALIKQVAELEGAYGAACVDRDFYKDKVTELEKLNQELVALARQSDDKLGRLIEYLRNSYSLNDEEIHNLILDLEDIQALQRCANLKQENQRCQEK